MEHTAGAKAPMHLWIVGILALLWNGFGCFDYFMTRTKGAEHIRSMMPDVDADAYMAYINAFPIWASLGWGLGVWGGLVGSILLLMRHRWAAPAFALSLLGALLGIGYQLMNPVDIPAMHGGANDFVPYLVLILALFLAWYSRDLAKKGLLR